VAPYTADSDLTLDPYLLAEREPALSAVMESAGFRLATREAGGLEPGIWVVQAKVNGAEVQIPVDLIVPSGVSPNAGRRGARLGLHGNSAARNIAGLEAVLVDHSPMTVSALDPVDSRSVTAEVAGLASLLVAKAHKVQDRVRRGVARRIHDKDAADVIRIMQTTSAREIGARFRMFIDDEVAGQPTIDAVRYLQILFGRRHSEGTEMAARALNLAVAADTVGVIATNWVAALVDDLA
jgi:hypothetical protein